MANSLYICYFGVREPLVQTQVIPYLRELIKSGHRISLLTFEAATGDEEKRRQDEKEIKEELAFNGIEWHSLKYHKRLSAAATAWDVFQGVRFIRKFIRREKPDILHGRVHIPTLMAVLAGKAGRGKPKVLFDIRGFFPEEYTDAGIWPANGLLYRMAKWVERWLLRNSDAFVVLTERARDVLFPDSLGSGQDKYGRPVEVIPCCVDLKGRFDQTELPDKRKSKEELGISERLVVVHTGALGGLYLTREIADFLAAVRSVEPSLFCIFLTQSDSRLIIPLLEERDFEQSDFLVTKVLSNEVPRYLAASDIGLSFVRSSYATISRSPTKIPEYLAAGIPIIANKGVGDVDELIEKYNVGQIIAEFSGAAYISAFRALKQFDIGPQQYRSAATEEFDLENVGGLRYRRLYKVLSEDKDRR